PGRDDDAATALVVAGRRELGVLAGDVGDVLVAAQDPEAAVLLGPGHRAGLPQLAVGVVRRELRVVVIEVDRRSLIRHGYLRWCVVPLGVDATLCLPPFPSWSTRPRPATATARPRCPGTPSPSARTAGGSWCCRRRRGRPRPRPAG